MVTTVAEMQAILTLDDSQFKTGMAEAKDETTSFGSRVSSAGKNMATFGAQASLALAPVTLFLASSVSAFRDFDVAMTNSQAILGTTNKEMEILNAQVLAMGSNTGLGPQAVADAFFTVVSGVQDTTTHMDILQNSINLAEAGMADLSVTTDGMVAVMNAYKFSAEDAAFVSDVMARTVQTGVGTMDQFVSAIKSSAGFASVAGVSFQELATDIAWLTSKGATASEAGNQLTATMVAFLKPNAKMIEALEAMGIESAKTLIEERGLISAVSMLSDHLGGNEEAMIGVMGRQEAMRGAFALLEEGAFEFNQSFSRGMEGSTEAARALQNATDEAISDAFMAKVDTAKILIGEGLSGAIADAQEAFLPFLESIITFAQENPETVEQIVMFTAALIGLALAFTVVGGVITVVGGIIGLLLSPIGLVILAVGMLVVTFGTLLGVNFGPFQDAIDSMFIAIGGATRDLIVDLLELLGVVDMVNGVRVTESTTFVDPSQFNPNAANSANIVGPIPIPPTPKETRTASTPGFADGGDFGAMQAIRVGERGPETVVFPQAGTVIPAEQSAGGPTFHVTIHANDEAGGRAAGRGFKAELATVLVRNG